MKAPNEIAYVFGGAVNASLVRDFMQRHSTFTKADFDAWYRDTHTTAVRAIADPKSKTPWLCGVILCSFKQRHIRLDRVLVPPALRRKRIATNMFYSMVVDPSAQAFASISAFVSDNNDAGILWLKSCHFRAISVLPESSPEGRDEYLFSWSFDNIRNLKVEHVEDRSVRDRESDRAGRVEPAKFPDDPFLL